MTSPLFLCIFISVFNLHGIIRSEVTDCYSVEASTIEEAREILIRQIREGDGDYFFESDRTSIEEISYEGITCIEDQTGTELDLNLIGD